MAFNFGIAAGAPPRKKSGLPPKVGGKPGLAVMIAAIPKKGGPPKDGDEGPSATGGPLLPRAAGRKSAPPGRAFTAPDEEPDDMLEDLPGEMPVGGGGEDHPILPEAVCYRSEQETCANCVHMQDDGECARLHIPVAHGDGCNLFSDASGGDADESAERFEPEEEGEEEEENEPAYR